MNSMKTKSRLHQITSAVLIAVLSIFALTPVRAQDAPEVTVFNYVRAESDLQMKLYIDRDDCFGKFVTPNVGEIHRCADGTVHRFRQ